MKTLIAAALLLALTSPAFAFGDHADWDCGNQIGVTMWKNQISLSAGGDPFSENAVRYTEKSSGRFDLRWDRKNVWMNGKKCVYLTDNLHWTKYCAEGDKSSCDELKEGWSMTPEQIERAVKKWRASWPGNTVRKP
jgi:hypothetical protein